MFSPRSKTAIFAVVITAYHGKKTRIYYSVCSLYDLENMLRSISRKANPDHLIINDPKSFSLESCHDGL